MPSIPCYYCETPSLEDATVCPGCGQPLRLNERYRLLRVLGQGGFGVVYQSTDLLLRRRCAVKVVTSVSSAEQRQVEAEVHILSQFASRLAFIPDVYDVWSDGARTFIAMEFIEGATLDALAGQPWGSARVESFLRTLLQHLAQLHGAGIVHRDIKPHNIVYTPDGRFVLLDFGIAKRGGATLTAARALSPDYASPEQFRGLPTDERSDLYSLAATAFHLLVGQPPASAAARLANNAPLSFAVPAVPGVSGGLQATLARMLALDPAARPASALAALALLDAPTARQAAGRTTRPAKRGPTERYLSARTWATAAALAAVLIGLLGTLLSRQSQQPLAAVTTAAPPAPTATSLAVASGPTSPSLPQGVELNQPLRDVPISLEALATGNIRDPMPSFPVGDPVLGGVQFHMDGERNFVQTRCEAGITPSASPSVSVSLGGVANPRSIYVLLNSAYSGAAAPGSYIGTMQIAFEDGQKLSVGLRLGHNIRDWNTGDPGSASALESQDVAEVYRGPGAFHTPGVVDMMAIDLPEPLQHAAVTSLVLRDESQQAAQSANPCLVLWGVTVRAAGGS